MLAAGFNDLAFIVRDRKVVCRTLIGYTPTPLEIAELRQQTR